MSKIIVLSDIHANADVLHTVLSDKSANSTELFIILGDLLTYGTRPNEVIEILKDLDSKCRVIFIKGNHDQFYFNLNCGDSPSTYPLPSFVEESVYWTHSKLKYNLAKEFEWHDSFEHEGIYFSHANPYEYGDWSYINSCKSAQQATQKLIERNYSVGVFGHTHRRFLYTGGGDEEAMGSFASEGVLPFNGTSLINPGSLGQPRGMAPCYLSIDIRNQNVYYKYWEVKTSINNEIKKILDTSLTKETKSNLIKYWKELL